MKLAEERTFCNHPDIFAGVTVHLLMLATMCPYIVCASLAVMLTFWIVTELLDFILIKIEFHSRPLSVGSHAKKERGYPIRVLISIVPSYTTLRFVLEISDMKERIDTIEDDFW